jgi:hypothetical protein
MPGICEAYEFGLTFQKVEWYKRRAAAKLIYSEATFRSLIK